MKNLFASRRFIAACPYISAVLTPTAFPPWNFSIFVWFCFVPWLYFIANTDSWRKVLLHTTIMSTLMAGIGYCWLHYLFTGFFELPTSTANISLFLFSFYCQLHFVLLGALFYFLKTKNLLLNKVLHVFILAALFTGIDWIYPKLFTDTFGYTLHQWYWIKQVVDIGGPFTLTFLTFFINFSLFTFFVFKNRSPLFVGAAIFVAFNLYGIWRINYIENLPEKYPFTPAIVQDGIGDFKSVIKKKGQDKGVNDILDNLFDISVRAISSDPKPDMLLWGETTYPPYFRKPYSDLTKYFDRRIEEFVFESKIPLSFGSYDLVDNTELNTIYFLNPDKNLPKGEMQFYHKSILIPFGEYIPLIGHLKSVQKKFPQLGHFKTGTGPKLFEIKTQNGKHLKFYSIICYESLFPELNRTGANLGADFIVNATKDYWFGQFGEPYFHLAFASFRSIETRLPQIRAANTGISAFISATGKIEQSMPLNETGFLKHTYSIKEPPQTLYKMLGNWFPILCLILGLFGYFWILRKRVNET